MRVAGLNTGSLRAGPQQDWLKAAPDHLTRFCRHKASSLSGLQTRAFVWQCATRQEPGHSTRGLVRRTAWGSLKLTARGVFAGAGDGYSSLKCTGVLCTLQ